MTASPASQRAITAAKGIAKVTPTICIVKRNGQFIVMAYNYADWMGETYLARFDSFNRAEDFACKYPSYTPKLNRT